MEFREQYAIFWLLFIFVDQCGSDWLNCAHIVNCHCKWSSGKKTASCTSASLTYVPRLASEIQILDMHENPLKELSMDAFAKIDLLNLQRLNLSSTMLQTIHRYAFRELKILIELDLSQNHLNHLLPDTFSGNDRLRVLILNDNPLNNLVAMQFPPLQHLKKLELSRCQLKYIHPLAFINLKSLETVYVDQNLLSSLHPNTFNLMYLKTLVLSDNPWHCDCRLREFHEWFLNANLGNDEVICAGPAHAQLSWHDVKSQDMICPPLALSSPTVIRTEIGATIKFGCFVNGDPKPTTQWFFQHIKISNFTFKNSEISIHKYQVEHYDDYTNDALNKSSQWVNITINNITNELSGEWKCNAKSDVGESNSYLTVFLPKARTETTRVAPNYSAFIIVVGSMLGMASLGCLAAYMCWKIRKRHLPPSRSFTDQERKLLDTSLAVSCDRTSIEMGSSYGFEMLDRSLSLESVDSQQRLEPLQISIESASEVFPPPPAEFAIPTPYANIFISVLVSGPSDKYPDLLGDGATLPRRSKTCLLKPTFDNLDPKVTSSESSSWSLPSQTIGGTAPGKHSRVPLSTYSTEFTAL